MKTDPKSPYRLGAHCTPMYKELIVELSGCSTDEAGGVEQIMRDTFRTLDGLSRAQFRKESRLALRVLHQLWEE